MTKRQQILKEKYNSNTCYLITDWLLESVWGIIAMVILFPISFIMLLFSSSNY